MKKALCILLALLMAGCTVPAEQTEGAPQSPIEDVVLETTEPVAQPEEEPLEGIWSEELTALMEEINAEHRAVEKQPVSAELYDEYYPERERLPLPKQPDTELMVEVLTQAQAIYDVSYLCSFLSDNYSLYDYFGGDDAFVAARDAMIEEILTQEQWTPKELRTVILKNLSFVQDHHFSVGATPVLAKFPIFYRNVEFMKTEDGFATTDGKLVESVEGQDLEQLFKRSLSVDGDIVYYPILFSEHSYIDGSEQLPGDLKVRYIDGTEELLPMELYDDSFQNDENKNKVVIEEVEGIKKLTFKNFMNTTLVSAGEDLQGEAVAFIDIRDNGGGHADYGWRFWESYTGTKTSGNHLIYMIPKNSEYLDNRYNVGVDSTEGRAIMNTDPDCFVENDTLTVLLTGKFAYSAAEDFTDTAHNVENVLIVGENTAGCLISGSIYQKTLRYSNLYFSYGETATIWPENHFAEGYGLEPDLWCPAAYAEEAAINFLKKNVQ